MARIKRKYIDSHWLVFIFQGAVALFFGCITLFTADRTASGLMPIIGIALLTLAVIEFANSIYRSYNQQGWVVSVGVALFDAFFGIVLLFVTNEGMAWQLVLLSLYTLLRGIFEFLIGLKTTVDPTDRFIWALCGVCGIIFGFVIFNSGHLQNVDFVRFFGAYLLILGTSSLIYSIHNREQQQEDRVARSEAARKWRAERQQVTAKAAPKSTTKVETETKVTKK